MFFKSKKPPVSERRARPSSQPPVRSNAVFSYHANRSVRELTEQRDSGREQNQPANRQKGRRMWAKRMPLLASALAVVIVGALCLQVSSQATIKTIDVKGGQLFLRDKKVYEQAAREAFTPWLNSNKLTVNGAKISEDLKRQFPELQVVSVSLPFFGSRPTVFVQPAIPKIILMTKDGMFVLDVNGRALIAGNQVARLTDLGVPIVTDESGIKIDVGNLALPRSTVSFITEVTGQMQAKHLRLTSIVLPAGTNEMHVKLEGAGYIVKYNLHGNAREEAGTFLAVKHYLETNKKPIGEYVDVRVENKAYYK